jgi:hypothetical protein
VHWRTYWSEIPEKAPWWCVIAKLPPRRGSRPPYRWIRAIEEEFEGEIDQDGYFSVALGSIAETPTPADQLGLKFTGVVAGGRKGGVFIGRWSSGKLTLRRAQISDGDFSQTGGPSSVAVCEQFRHRVYAACARSDGIIHMIVRSEDGGQTWKQTKYGVKSATVHADLHLGAGDQGAGCPPGKGCAPNNCIAVHPSIPEILAVGWLQGPFISLDGGQSWTHAEPTHHVDLHALLFKPMPDSNHQLYVASDGGLAQIRLRDVFSTGLAGIISAVIPRSDYNRRLATWQCYSTWVTRDFYGTMAVSPVGSGWLSSGLQDNGTVYCKITSFATPWRQLDSGDGGWNAMANDGGLVFNTLYEAAQSAQSAPNDLINRGIVPLTLPAPGDPGGLVTPVGDAVREPYHRNQANQLMSAVAGGRGPRDVGYVYGLFEAGRQTYHWERLGQVPDDLVVTAAGSYRGETVLVGAGAGRMFRLDSSRGTVSEMAIDLPHPAPTMRLSGGAISRILTLQRQIAFAAINRAGIKRDVLGPGITTHYILRLEGEKWVVPASIGLPIDEPFYALDGFVRPHGSVIFAATDDRVYMSEDAGEHWVGASMGLPRRPHCADLRVGLADGRLWLFLSTSGRSVWRASMGAWTGH